jgi:hypothetical protein
LKASQFDPASQSLSFKPIISITLIVITALIIIRTAKINPLLNFSIVLTKAREVNIKITKIAIIAISRSKLKKSMKKE